MIITIGKQGTIMNKIVGTQDLDVMQFSIDNSLVRTNEVYLRLYSIKNKLYDIVRLHNVKPQDASHQLYAIVSEQKIRVNNEKVIMKLIFLGRDGESCTVSSPMECVISTDNYSFTRQTAIAQEIQLSVADYYNKIYAMYQQLNKEENINDNIL